MCTRPKTTDYDDAGGDIEQTLGSIKSIARIIHGLDGADLLEPDTLSYLADRLIEDYDEIYDAWSRIFGFGEYSDKTAREARHENS